VKTKIWLLLIGALLVLCAVLSIILMQPSEAAFAEIYSDGKLLYTLDLQKDQTLTVESKWGENVITVREGKIAVTQADCPDGYCMARGFCSGGAQIVCLPNRLVIRFTQQQEIDGVVG